MKRSPILKHLIENEESEGHNLISIVELFKRRIYQYCRGEEKIYSEFKKDIASFKDGGNDAIAIVKVNEQKSITFFAHSTIDEKNENTWAKNQDTIEIAFLPPVEERKFEKYIFKTTPNRDINSGDIPRIHDTEYKLLENIASYLKFESSVKGEIKVYTTLQPCFSCDSVFLEFNRCFPEVRIDVFYKKEYNVRKRKELF
ncbi:deaminase domain-containing protein [Planomicrobium okeanokoites]|uniref:deaminase domain-containing protein n=1 Tax=Planomicrobium okeanokoites TaxID=244 RepID=UPI0030FB8C3B